MHENILENKYFSICLMIVAGILALFFWEGNQGFSIWDEGFLWYGAQRVLAGEVPIRDFNAYDIGRYYWSAAFMKVSGSNGLISLRMAATLFQIMTLCIGLTALIRNSIKQSLIFWLLVIVTLIAWMIPTFRLFDISLPILLICALSFLIEKPSDRRYFLTGLTVGLVAVFGRNHGLYGLIGSIGVMFYLFIKRDSGPKMITAFLTWSLGIVVGYLPMLIFLIFVPGFASAFWESIRLLFETGVIDLPLPVPWPWSLPFGQMSFFTIMRGIMIGLLYIAVLVFGILGIVYVIRQKLHYKYVSPMLVASVFLILPYAHYVHQRPNMLHLVPGSTPLLMCIFAILASQSSKLKWLLIIFLCSMIIFIMYPTHIGWKCPSGKRCINVKVVGDNLKVQVGTAHNLWALDNIAKQFIPKNKTFICAPFSPGAYAVLERKSAMWDIMPIFPSSVSSQEAEIQRIKAAEPSFVIIDNSPLDGQEDLRFSNTHPIIERYIRENYIPVHNYKILSMNNYNLRYYRNRNLSDDEKLHLK